MDDLDTLPTATAKMTMVHSVDQKQCSIAIPVVWKNLPLEMIPQISARVVVVPQCLLHRWLAGEEHF